MPKKDRKNSSQEWVSLVGKTFPHLVGVFCTRDLGILPDTRDLGILPDTRDPAGYEGPRGPAGYQGPRDPAGNA